MTTVRVCEIILKIIYLRYLVPSQHFRFLFVSVFVCLFFFVAELDSLYMRMVGTTYNLYARNSARIYYLNCADPKVCKELLS